MELVMWQVKADLMARGDLDSPRHVIKLTLNIMF